MTDLPEPLVPAEVDLRDLDGFMLNVERLLASELWALSNGTQLKAALALWCRAWKQVPAASLPDDDLVLAPFAGLTAARFKEERWIVLRGFIKCKDGRLYHKVLAQDALRAWESKRRRVAERNAEAERLKRWRERRRKEDEARSATGGETHDETRTNGVRQGQGQGRKNSSEANASDASDASTGFWRGSVAKMEGLGVPAKQARSMIGKWRKTNDDDAIMTAITAAHEAATPDPIPYIVKALASAGNGRPDWWP